MPANPPPELVLYNTLGRRREPFSPLHEGEARLYTCGPTVYNYAHIGNLRTFVFEDLLRRTLRRYGYRVTQVMNITDIDDKIIARTVETGSSIEEHTGPYIDAFFEDLDALHMERAEHYPLATSHIDEMIELVAKLLERGQAYESDGSVFFRLAGDPDYGKLSGHDLSQARRGERVESDEYGKEDVKDFVLWKGAKPGEPSWPAPFGEGRPGWHIECSAMSMKYLGPTLDIHTGGVDNIFPHHENEIAQSEGATGRPFARHWLHAEHLIVEGEKMSKSLGNQYTLRDLVERGIEPRAMRYLFLSVHYRQKLNFTFEGVAAAGTALTRLDEMQYRLREAHLPAGQTRGFAARVDTARERFDAALADDLNTSAALAAVHTFARDVNIALTEGVLTSADREAVGAFLAEIDDVFAVLDASTWQRETTGDLDETEVDRLVTERDAARAGRDFAAADRLRDELERLGVKLEDTPEGTKWRRR